MFQYHGAEHKAIAAYENDVELTPETAQQFSTAHVRCGTNFLLTVMVVAVFVYSVIPRPNLWFVIASRIVLMPRDRGPELRGDPARGEEHAPRAGCACSCGPGCWLQKLTTREPDLDQLEVAIASLRAVFTAEQTRRGRDPRRPARPGHRACGLTPSPHFYTPGDDRTLQLTWTERRAARRPRRRRAARRGRRAVPRRIRRRRRVRVAAHAQPRARDRARGSSRTASSSAPRSSTRRSSCGPRCSRTSRSRSTCSARACASRRSRR